MAKAELPKKGDLRRNRRAPGSPKQVWSPGEFIGYGILTLIVGGWMAAVLAYATGILGVLVLIAVGVAGQVMILIGVIAKGVSLGIRDVELRKKPTRPAGRVLTHEDMPPVDSTWREDDRALRRLDRTGRTPDRRNRHRPARRSGPGMAGRPPPGCGPVAAERR